MSSSFGELLELSQKGDNSNTDMLVGDIYGGMDYSKFGRYLRELSHKIQIAATIASSIAEGITLKLHPRSKVALVGPSGGGKCCNNRQAFSYDR
ncbi:hypothetical protein JHK87_027852 [Glycine soja]|nr:hypothetical protein JHK87_027852 [Glycine soja]